MHMSYCPLVGEPISSLAMFKIELLRPHTQHPRWGSQLLNCKLPRDFNAASLRTTLGKARVEVSVLWYIFGSSKKGDIFSMC